MRGCNCGTVHKDAHAPGCSGFAVEFHSLSADNDALRVEVARLTAERDALAGRLSGLRPEFPPMPPDGAGLPRYGLLWPPAGTFTGPLATPMADGYWTPWHLAEAERDAARAALRDVAVRQREACEEVVAVYGTGEHWSEVLRLVAATPLVTDKETP